jgi:hypothetical protein
MTSVSLIVSNHGKSEISAFKAGGRGQEISD